MKSNQKSELIIERSLESYSKSDLIMNNFEILLET